MSRQPLARESGASFALTDAVRDALTAPLASVRDVARRAHARGLTRPIGHGLIFAGLLLTGYLFLVVAPGMGTFGFDSYAYWSVSTPDAYTVPHGSLGSFAYTPPVALAMDPFGSVGWLTFALLWTALLVGTIVFLGGGVVPILAALAFPPVALELYHGNIHLLLAAAVVLGFRHPWTWSIVLLTKPTAGVGLLWFAVRGEWRSLAIALGSTAAIVLATLLVVPGMWLDWTAYVSSVPQVVGGSSAIPIPLWLRLAAGAVIVIWGARTDRRWTVIVAATLALPVLWIAGLAMLVGIIPELRGRRRSHRPDDEPGEVAVASASSVHG